MVRHMVRHLLSLSLLLAGLAGLSIASAPAVEDKEEWKPLFNGKDLTGWKMHPEPNKQAIKELIKKESDGKVIAYYGRVKSGEVVPLWHVEDGILIGSGPFSHLFSERDDYKNFRYRIEVTINDHGNSGQYFRW